MNGNLDAMLEAACGFGAASKLVRLMNVPPSLAQCEPGVVTRAELAQAQAKLGGGVESIPDADLNAALDEANVPPKQSDAAVSAYQEARVSGLKSALAILALATVIALLLAQKIPTEQPGAKKVVPEPGVAPQTSV